MPRLPVEFLERVESLCDRVLDLTEALSGAPHPRRLIEQIAAAGTSVGANIYEANQAMSRADCISRFHQVLLDRVERIKRDDILDQTHR